jgi:hypothetical protein
MISLPSLLAFVHLVGLSLAVGAATVKLVLLIKFRSNSELIPVFIKASKPITQLIITGLFLLTFSGIGWLLMGYSFTTLLIIKLIFVAAIWILGPVIDNVIEPKFLKLAPVSGQQASAEFAGALNKYLGMEIIATGFFYVIIIIWILI